MTFDRSLLPAALLEFVVVADTHYLPDPGSQALEFASRRLQSARANWALRQVAALEADVVVHMGDLTQVVAGAGDFERALAEAREQLAHRGVRPRLVAGNQDIGDKPDPTMPQEWVTPASLARYHEAFGRSWYSWDAGGLHFVVLNSQIMNAHLPEAEEQARWLEADLAANAGRRIIAFTHVAPFLHDPSEPGLGHYDNIDEPARGWLLDRLRRSDVEALFCGHSHFAFFNRAGATRLYVTPSTSHTRPGFSELFASGPPDEQGRNDVAKLGFFLVRVHEYGSRVHLIRTNGWTDAEASHPEPAREQRLVTGTPRDLPSSPVGLTLRHQLASEAEVPIAWPSTIRQPVRNDYPLLAAIELGARHVRVPVTDLDNRTQRERLGFLRDEGVQVTATWLWPDRATMPSVERSGGVVDYLEIQLAGGRLPDDACLAWLRNTRDELGVPLALTPVIPGERVPGKQLARTRIGYRLDELTELDEHLARRGARVGRVTVRVGPNEQPWHAAQRARLLPRLASIGAIDWLVELSSDGDGADVGRTAEAIFAAALVAESRVFLEPLVDLDRTMDVTRGLLDRQCNPRPPFHAARCANTVVFGAGEHYEAGDEIERDGARVLGLVGATSRLFLILPNTAGCEALELDLHALDAALATAGSARVYRLANGTSERVTLGGAAGQQIRLVDATIIRV